MNKKYDHRAIEKKWQKTWDEKKEFRSEVDLSKPKYYILDMFPYPSGAGLHVGHVTGYTATDIIARYKRQKGFNVLHPMGWDSFGLPAEQYAIRTGTHPAVTTQDNINTYRRQLKSMGFSYDWDREITTSEPSYYKWTQWIFTKLYEKGLAYEAEMMVNFCPALGTVLANEEVDDGKSKEGGYPIERRPLRQWVLKITEYADQLIEDLDLIDWPDHLKKLQVHWIGKSEGAKIHFNLEQGDGKIVVFTTCPHTIYGVTYLVLAPEHPLVSQITTKEQKTCVREYLDKISSKSDLERTDLAKEKTGVSTGSYAIHPITQEKIPIWISDYVLVNYGTGAVMAVPSHDQRDFEFANLFNLPKIEVVQSLEPHDGCYAGEGVLINSGPFTGIHSEEAKKKITEHLTQNGVGEKTVQYKLRDWIFSRQRYWGEPFPILHFEDGSKRCLDLDELPLCPPEVTDYKPLSSGESPLAKVSKWVEIIDLKTGKKAWRETNTMPQWAGSCWYYLRFCDPKNSEAAFDPEIEKYWMPVDLYVGGIEHAVLHLLYARFWHKVLFDAGLVSTKEPFQTLRNQGLVIARAFQKKSGGYVLPEDVDEVDGRYVLKKTGELLNSQIEKMSKSKLNGMTPDEIVEEYGADTLRLYEMFMGPFEKEKIWNQDALMGCKRFLNRYFDLVYSDKVSKDPSFEAMKLVSRLAHVVALDIEQLQFNTAIAKMMEFMNEFCLLDHYPVDAICMLTQILYPFAPHIAEEAWEFHGKTSSLTYAPYPEVLPEYLEDKVVMYVVQVNGKLRGKWEFPKDQTEKEILQFIEMQPNIKKHVTGSVKKVIHVKNRLINLVVE